MSIQNSSKIELCRLCLTDEGVTCPIFAVGASNLVKIILECTCIEIEPIDGVPSNICEVCKSKLVICSQFIRQCQKTQEKIRKLYERHFESQKCHDPNQELEIEEIELIEYAPDQEDLQNETNNAGWAKTPEAEEVYLVEIVKQPHQKGTEKVVSDEKKIQVFKNDCSEESDKPDDTIPEEVPLNSKQNLPTSTHTSKNQNDSLPIDTVSQSSCEGFNLDQMKDNSVIINEGGIKKYKKKCPICGVLQQNLKQHMNVHSGARKHVCAFCGKAFSQRGNLTCHLNIHTGYKPHKCDQCSKSFGDPTALKMHKINHSDEPNFECDLCQTTFRFKHSLQTHLRSHRNERNHACSYCDMAFVTSSSLKKHIRTHTGERPYKCDLCTKSFICGGHLQQHKKTHFRDNAYQCEKCKTAFKTKATLKHHMEIHDIISCAL
ncbi:zinc finger protein 808-like [Ochlerotatus camptorhynchus]|uniref:zinc finger protein 808-like n=1 Tax=Ochlerotatus camptorhynchus TaxID=644619 RepID=UPI0031E108B1